MDIVYNINNIDEVITSLWQEGQAYKVWCFYAPMGSGKTTLIHQLCIQLGINDAVSSPTFSIINEYNSPTVGPLFHMDWYRLKDEEEAIQAGVEETLFSSHYCFVEWPEKAQSLLPESLFKIYLEIIDPITRRLYTLNA